MLTITGASRTSRYSSKIIKASALLPDTKLLLANWDVTASVRDNLRAMLHANVFGKASRSRVEDVLAIFRQRYLGDPALLCALVTLVKGRIPDQSLDRILYFLALRSDPLLHDAVTEVIAPLAQQGRREVDVRDLERWLREQVAAGRTTRPWNEETTTRVAQGILATLRDFGLLEGAATKRIASPYLPVDAFCFIAFLLKCDQPSGERLISHPEWQVFLLHPNAVERLFVEAHQERLLEYYAAGPVIRIEFPARSIEDYAHALAQRAH